MTAPLSAQVESLLRQILSRALPGEVEARARLLLLDTLACAVAASPAIEPLVEKVMEGRSGTLSLPVTRFLLDPPAVALILGTAACWDEACEGLARAHGRPGLHAIPAAVATALRRRASLADVLEAIVVGYEVAGRLGEVLRIRPGMHVDGTWGIFGATVAAARLEGLDVRGMLAAIQHAACGIPASLYLPISRGAQNRNLYAGQAAVRALEATAMAAAGIATPPDALEETARILFGLDPATPTLAPPGESLLLQGYLKPFAGVRHAHYPAAAAIAWRARHGGTEDITAIRLETYPEAVTYAGVRAPTGAIQAQFSLAWATAHALRTGTLGPEAYRADALADVETRRLEALVILVPDAARDATGTRGARLLITRDGTTTESAAERIAGDPGLPMTEAEVRAKALTYASPRIGPAAASRLADALLTAPPGTPLAACLGADTIA